MLIQTNEAAKNNSYRSLSASNANVAATSQIGGSIRGTMVYDPIVEDEEGEDSVDGPNLMQIVD